MFFCASSSPFLADAGTVIDVVTAGAGLDGGAGLEVLQMTQFWFRGGEDKLVRMLILTVRVNRERVRNE